MKQCVPYRNWLVNDCRVLNYWIIQEFIITWSFTNFWNAKIECIQIPNSCMVNKMNFGWSYKQENWNLFKNTFLNNSWSSCSFTYDSYSIVPKSRGVYLIISSPLESNSKDSYQAPFDTMATPLYIGHSINLQNRFKTHTSK